MPFTKRAISPVNVSQHRLPPNIRQNELECVANGTLANLIRQLSSLSRHAEDIFGELYREAVKIEHKTNTLFNRIDRLAVKVTQLDSKIEEGTVSFSISLRVGASVRSFYVVSPSAAHIGDLLLPCCLTISLLFSISSRSASPEAVQKQHPY